MAANADFWDNCVSSVSRADILLVLYNGNAGFGNTSASIGICHAELMAALQNAGAKVRLIDVRRDASSSGKTPAGDKARNQRFDEYLDAQQLGRRFARDDQDAIRLLLDALQDAVVEMVRLGGGETRKGRFDTGAPLDWSRLDYAQRKSAIERVLLASLGEAGAVEQRGGCVHKIAGRHIHFRCHAVPAAMAVAAAREMVGRPFLRDHEWIEQIEGSTVGPVHVIACHKGVTENQAVSLLGFPDATILTPPFGVYVADNIQKIQLVFLANCRDETSTRFAAQRFLEWLARSGEAPYLAERARGRKAIVSAIAEQLHREASRPRNNRTART